MVQMAYKEEQASVEKRERLREVKEAADAERAHMARVHSSSAHTPPMSFGRPKVQWFY
jgi:hypothetical protein